MWKRTKKECPTCRAPIAMENRHHLTDEAISNNYSQLPDNVQQKRLELVRQREDEWRFLELLGHRHQALFQQFGIEARQLDHQAILDLTLRHLSAALDTFPSNISA